MAIVKIIDDIGECAGCPPEFGCIGNICANRKRTTCRTALVCDACGREIANGDKLCRAPYQREPAYVCEACLDERLEWYGMEGF